MTRDQKWDVLERDDPVVLEIGSQMGIDTREFLDEFPSISIYCFEPDPRCITEFKKSISDDRCILIEAAVSNRDGKTMLNLSAGWKVKVPQILKNLGLKKLCTLALLKYRKMRGTDRNSTGQSSICRVISHSKKYPWLSFNKSIEVTTIKLDTWIKKSGLNAVDIMWVDVQGAERLVIEGAANTLRMVKYLQIEYGETSAYPDAMTRIETIELLSGYGFEVAPEYSDTRQRGDLLFVNAGASDHRH